MFDLFLFVHDMDGGERIMGRLRTCRWLSAESVGQNIDELLATLLDYLFRADLFAGWSGLVLAVLHELTP